MLELLPNKQKNAVKKEYRLRLLSVLFLLLAFVGILSVVSISPSYFLSVEKEKIVKREFDQIVKSNEAIADDKQFRSDIDRTKEMISLLKPSDKHISASDLISKIISKEHSGVRINRFTITPAKGEQYQILMGGNAANRDILKLFVENLKNSSWFETVDLPISNFTKIYDIDFSITLKTAP